MQTPVKQAKKGQHSTNRNIMLCFATASYSLEISQCAVLENIHTHPIKSLKILFGSGFKKINLGKYDGKLKFLERLGFRSKNLPYQYGYFLEWYNVKYLILTFINIDIFYLFYAVFVGNVVYNTT